MELSIDTSTSFASLALSEAGNMLAELSWRCGQNHTVELLPAVDRIMAMMRLSKTSVTGVIVAKGPGSFNGLRVGIATAKGLGFALGVPVVGVSTLEIEAFPHLETCLPVCALHNAGRGEVAVALFQSIEGKTHRLWEEQIMPFPELPNRVAKRTLFCGEISEDMAGTLRDRLGPKAVIVADASALRRAGYLAELGWVRLRKGDQDDLATLQPLYLRRPHITVPKSRTGAIG